MRRAVGPAADEGMPSLLQARVASSPALSGKKSANFFPPAEAQKIRELFAPSGK
jgi:hypothetical protein